MAQVVLSHKNIQVSNSLDKDALRTITFIAAQKIAGEIKIIVMINFDLYTGPIIKVFLLLLLKVVRYQHVNLAKELNYL